jgi:hypothetical protein
VAVGGKIVDAVFDAADAFAFLSDTYQKHLEIGLRNINPHFSLTRL